MRVLLVIAAFCAGCALLPYGEDQALHPAALQDAYLVAHGMATSYAESPDANPAVVLELARLDLQAAAAVRTQDSGATEQAVAALTNYAARQSTAVEP